MRQAKTRAVLDQEFDEVQVVGKNINWPGLNFGMHAFVEVFNLE